MNITKRYDNEIKIIGGTFKGKLIPVLDAAGLRPTPSRVRETVFSWLSDYIENAKVLDLFSGSGALGFESLSRGAKAVVMVELNIDNSKNLSNIVSSLKTDRVTVINNDAVSYLKTCNECFDIVFIDPPYSMDNLYDETLSLLINRNLINNNSLIYVEMRNGSNHAIAGFEVIREQQAGQSKYSLWRKSQLLF